MDVDVAVDVAVVVSVVVGVTVRVLGNGYANHYCDGNRYDREWAAYGMLGGTMRRASEAALEASTASFQRCCSSERDRRIA